MSKKQKSSCTTLNYIENFLILPSTVTGCISISVFTSSIGIPIGITSSGIGLKIWLKISSIAARIKKNNSVINKEKEA